MGKYVILADCISDEIQPFVTELTYKGNYFQIESYISNWKRTGVWSELKRYATYFAVGFRCFLKRKDYEAIFGWQQFYALTFSFFCSLFRVKKSATVVALNFTYKDKKGIISGIYRWFMAKCVDSDYMDYIHVPSIEYADIFAEQFHFPRERIIVTCFGVNDCYDDFSLLGPPDPYQKDGYALAIGRSNRDYDFLIRSWKHIEYPLVIISDTYKRNVDSENILILNDVAGEESYPWIANCGLMVIALDDPTICSGDTVLLTAMAVKRKILVTAPSALAQMYIVNGKNAVLTPKDENEFCKLVNDLLFSDKYSNLGEEARESFLRSFSRQSMGYSISRSLGS